MTNQQSTLPSVPRPCSLSVITGHVGTGKTTEIIRRVGNLVEDGEDPSLIAIFTATDTACHTLAARLHDAFGAAADSVVVTTLLEQELSILATPEAKAATGRESRILLRFERNILMEDMKTSRVQPRRLAEMLKFFYRSWAELEPMDATWFYNEEEARVHALLKHYLDSMRAYLPAEVARTTYDFISAHGGAPHFRHVFVDDYQKLSRASQHAAALLASESFTIAGDELSPAPALEEFPHIQGITEFLAANPDCEHLSLSVRPGGTAIAKTVNSLLSDPALDARPLAFDAGIPEGTSELLPHTRPQDEFEDVANAVCAMLKKGAEPESIAVTAPNGIWVRNLARALEHRGVATSRLCQLQVSGDVRNLSACQEARVVTLLKLIAHPNDATALRCWCGFGDYLANSSLFSLAAEGACSINLRGISLSPEHARDQLTKNVLARVDQALEQARSIIAATETLAGKALVRALLQELGIPEDVPAAGQLLDLTADLPAEADAGSLCAEIERRALMPRRSGAGVFVGQLEDMTGCSANTVIITGLVNGFTPSRSYFDPTIVERDKRPALLKREMAHVCECAGKAHQNLALSYFTEIPLVDAESLNLKVFRVRLKGKERICEIHPSETIRAITGERFND